jgi:hypothetical protein
MAIAGGRPARLGTADAAREATECMMIVLGALPILALALILVLLPLLAEEPPELQRRGPRAMM